MLDSRASLDTAKGGIHVSSNTKARPNILLIASDQQHWNTLGCLNPELKTPARDALAREGTLFNRAYGPNPTCTPTRATMIAGKYPSQHGAYSLGTKLPESEHAVGEDFQKAGYRTALVGKAHFQQLHGTEQYPSLESYPIRQDLEYWRDHILVENRHQPTTIHCKTRVDRRYKIAVYWQRDYGEVFDLQEDPKELNNLWHDPGAQNLKAELIRQLLFSEMGKEPVPMPRVAAA
jgi:arylsulfatase A-like enzyme